LTTKQRHILNGVCEVSNNGKLFFPNKSILIFSKNGLIFGKIEIENTLNNNQDLKQIHLSEDVIIKYRINNDSLETACIIYELINETNRLTFILSSFAHELSKKRLSFFSYQGSTPHSPLNAILRSAGILKKYIKIEGFEEKFVPYLVLIPIENLVLENPEFGLGDVTFVTKYEAFARFKGFKEKFNDELFGRFDTFAQTIVESDNAYDAYLIGRKKVEDSIDMIIVLSKNERVFNFYNIGNYTNEWIRFRIYQNPKCSSHYYVEDIIGSEIILGDSNNTWENNSLCITSYFEKMFRELECFEDQLYEKQTGKNSNLNKQLFNALKWLNRSWKADNLEDKVIYTNISVEFLVESIKVKNNPYLPNEIYREFQNQLKQLLKEKNDIFIEEYSSKIKNKTFGALSNPSLPIKLEILIQQLDIPLTNEELEKLDKVRKYRNKLVHGSDNIEINPANVLVVNILLGEFIINRLKHMEEGG
jgi:Apea-like HEPN